MLPVQATLFSIRKALQAASSALRVTLGTNIVPVVDVTEQLELDSGVIHRMRGAHQFARQATITGAAGGQSQWRIENPESSGIVTLVDAIAVQNPQAASAMFGAEMNPPLATRAATLDGPLFALGMSLRRTPPGPVPGKTLLYFDTDAYAASAGLFQSLMVPPGDTRSFNLPRPIPLLPGMDLQVFTLGVATQYRCGFVVRELALNP